MNTIIRASSLPGYSDCARMWAARTLGREITALGYDLKSRLAPSVGASIGTATHSGAAYTLTSKMTLGNLGNQQEAEQRALEDFKTAASDGVLWDDPMFSDLLAKATAAGVL